ncbi:hypothetical protein JMJ35_000878 [Cladonia borealis]|uniref:Uncharacterized protein n=1 Tax=Cladonia borealis TaxID=184061 RepID=A0AA39R9I5_9LECA|nr:hypothetical protein JMJ35_000878 [Cladonia borealis]
MPFPCALGCSPHDSAQPNSHEGPRKCDHHYALCGLKYAATSMAIPTTAYITDLQARLAVLHDDYQELKKENDQKRAIIDHLLIPRITESKVATSNAINNTSQPTATSNNEARTTTATNTEDLYGVSDDDFETANSEWGYQSTSSLYDEDGDEFFSLADDEEQYQASIRSSDEEDYFEDARE